MKTLVLLTCLIALGGLVAAPGVAADDVESGDNPTCVHSPLTPSFCVVSDTQWCKMWPDCGPL